MEKEALEVALKWARRVAEQVHAMVDSLQETITAPRAFSPSPGEHVPKARVHERWTICEDCGKGILENETNWMDDGSSYCKSCRPRPRAMLSEVKE